MSTTAVAESAYEVRKMTDGGFLVSPGMRRDDFYRAGPCFACTTIEEALKYVKSKLDPKLSK